MRQKIIEMKNCPFCGGEAITRTVCGKEYISAEHKTKCAICPDTFKVSDLSLKKQAKRWNRRANDTKHSSRTPSVRKWKEDGEYLKSSHDCIIKALRSDVDQKRIKFCPVCGKKIEVIKNESD